ncbi:L-cysteine desulfidase family protein [Companilactobacillus jidongensis]|uniref:L-cysteine desulfidase family protein n=1 Tax=Companilactobacillus jidongensis TaxID=2486006 RepID=UPI001CDB5FAB|nr:L-serine ammonia-lyase, iron-sulfur-dependent, subunit alpha [Companilactobacillus jidongensis]
MTQQAGTGKGNYEQMFIRTLKEGVVPATGCTEPIAIAYAAANCMLYLTSNDIQKIDVSVSHNIMKNAMAVIVPGTGRPGLIVAAAAGAIAGDPQAGLSVISKLNETQLPEINQLVDSGKISTRVADVRDNLYVEVTISDPTDTVKVYIAGDHTNIFLIEKNGKTIYSKDRPAPQAISETKQFLQTVKLKDIWDFALTEPLANIVFMRKAANFNLALADDGFEHDYGVKVGKSLQKSKLQSNSSLTEQIISYSAAASDARMGGSQLPAMSNSGSGNQGITATIPVCIVAKHEKSGEEKLIRALTLSHLTALYIHAFLPVLSAFCATDSAAMGAATGSIYLLTNDYKEACSAIKNMIGDAAGMVCDGAGCSCAMKVATSISSMCRAVDLAIQGVEIPATNGLVQEDIDETIRGLGKLVTNGFGQTDSAILDVMMNK